MGKKIYKDNLESIVVSIPYDLMVWVRENGSFSDMVREILDRKTGDEPELNTPLKEYSSFHLKRRRKRKNLTRKIGAAKSSSGKDTDQITMPK